MGVIMLQPIKFKVFIIILLLFVIVFIIVIFLVRAGINTCEKKKGEKALVEVNACKFIMLLLLLSPQTALFFQKGKTNEGSSQWFCRWMIRIITENTGCQFIHI